MFTKNWKCVVTLVAVAAGCALANAVMADTLLFSDNFNSTASGDNTNINTGIGSRTAGTYSSATYTIQNNLKVYGTAGAYPGNLWLTTANGAGGSAILGHNFYGADSAGGLDVDLRAKPTSNGGSSEWAGLVIGNNGTTSPGIMSQGLLVLFRGSPSGGSDVFVRENDNTAATALLGQSNAFHDFHIKITGVGDNNPFDGSGSLNVKVYLDGSTTAGLDYTSSTVYATNYMGLNASGYSWPHLVDSLSISQIPEPSSIVLLVTGVLGLLARRRLRA